MLGVKFKVGDIIRISANVDDIFRERHFNKLATIIKVESYYDESYLLKFDEELGHLARRDVRPSDGDFYWYCLHYSGDIELARIRNTKTARITNPDKVETECGKWLVDKGTVL